MTKIHYSELLQDPRWQKKRLEILEYAGWRCQICGAQNITLHVHHSRYIKGKKPWQYPSGSLIAVCKPHHEMLHPEKKKEEPQVPLSPPADIRRPEIEIPTDPWARVLMDIKKERPLFYGNVCRLSFVRERWLIVANDELDFELTGSKHCFPYLEKIVGRHFNDGHPVELRLEWNKP